MTSKLREALKNITIKSEWDGQRWLKEPLFKVIDERFELEGIDRVIDAVIEALPAPKQIEYALNNDIHVSVNKDRFFRYGGYDFAIEEVKSILEEARQSD